MGAKNVGAIAGIVALSISIIASFFYWLLVPIEYTSQQWPAGPRLKCLQDQCAIHFNNYNGYPNAFRPLYPAIPFHFKPYKGNPTLTDYEDQSKWPQFVRDESSVFPEKFPMTWTLIGSGSLTGGSRIEVFVRSLPDPNEYEVRFKVKNQKIKSYIMERRNGEGIPYPKYVPFKYKQSRLDKFTGETFS